MSMQRMLEQSAIYHANRVAFIDGDTRLTYLAFRERVLRLADGLLALGLQPGDRVAIAALNTHRFHEWYFACCETGLIGVPVNIRFTPGEITSFLRYTAPRALLVDTAVGQLADALVPQVPSLEHVVGFGDGHGRAIDYEELLAASEPREPADSDPTRPVLITPTSGTTGVMKGAVLDQLNTYQSGLSWLGGFPMTAESRHVIALPLFFASGAPGWYLSLFVGAAIVILPRFEPHAFVDLVESTRATHAILGPALVYQLMDMGIDFGRLSSLEVLGAGGAPFDPTRFRALLERVGPKVYIFFGMTESAATASFLRPSDYLLADGTLTDRYTSIGKPWPGVIMRVAREDDTWVARNGEEVGEILLRGPGVSGGYWEMPEETRQTFAGGWLHTGDLATIDTDGFVSIIDRKKDIIVSGGINVASVEVEKVIGAHPAVAGVAVIGIPHDKWGEAVHAVVVRRPETDVAEAEIVEWCRGRLASFKKPQSVEFVDELPISSTGKVLKRELRDTHWAGRPTRVG